MDLSGGVWLLTSSVEEAMELPPPLEFSGFWDALRTPFLRSNCCLPEVFCAGDVATAAFIHSTLRERVRCRIGLPPGRRNAAIDMGLCCP